MAWHGPNGQQLCYEDTGRGDTVLLMLGWDGNIVEFYELRRELASGPSLPGINHQRLAERSLAPQPRRQRGNRQRSGAAAPFPRPGA